MLWGDYNPFKNKTKPKAEEGDSSNLEKQAFPLVRSSSYMSKMKRTKSKNPTGLEPTPPSLKSHLQPPHHVTSQSSMYSYRSFCTHVFNFSSFALPGKAHELFNSSISDIIVLQSKKI